MITLYACVACGHTVFPARKLCSRCGGAAWAGGPCDHGVVESVTALLADVRTPQAVRVIARLQHAISPGARVALHETNDGALWGIFDADQT